MGQVEWPLSGYLDPHSARPRRPRMNWPSPPRKGTEALFAEFDPPMAEWPAGMSVDSPVQWQAKMTMYDRHGVPFAQGSAARRVWWGGYETIEVEGKSYADCVRLRAETDLHFGWWASFRLRETVWVAQHVGIIRRVERLGGRALLLFRFDSEHEYVLLAHEIEASKTEGSSFPRRWARLAVYLDRSIPRPRVGGLAVEWALGAFESSHSTVGKADGVVLKRFNLYHLCMRFALRLPAIFTDCLLTIITTDSIV